MGFRKPLVTALAVVLLAGASIVPTGAHANATHKMYLTFNRPVALPGVSLGTGTYIFEIPDATADPCPSLTGSPLFHQIHPTPNPANRTKERNTMPPAHRGRGFVLTVNGIRTIDSFGQSRVG